jgi:hypothetical protein
LRRKCIVHCKQAAIKEVPGSQIADILSAAERGALRICRRFKLKKVFALRAQADKDVRDPTVLLCLLIRAAVKILRVATLP